MFNYSMGLSVEVFNYSMGFEGGSDQLFNGF